MEQTKADTRHPAKPQKRSSEDNTEEISEQVKKNRRVVVKPFEAQNLCVKCFKTCALKIDINRQKKLYNSFHSRSRSEQTFLIRSLVQRTPASAKVKAHNPIVCMYERKYKYRYILVDEEGIEQEVCCSFFRKCFQLTASRILFAVDTLETNPDAVDFRGRCAAVNKTPEEDTKNVISFIDLLPKYEQNYSRTSSDTKLLHPDLSLHKLYTEYKLRCDQKQQKAVCDGVFRAIFHNNFKLRFKRFSSNTCKTCSYYSDQLQKDLPKSERVEIENCRDKHKELVEKINTEFNRDIVMAPESEKSSLILTFGLQRALETPSLTSTVASYKRPLWTHNLCIHDEVAMQSYMYVWNESIASKRALEIGSCLLYHLKHYMCSTIENIILYTGSNASQSCNIKMALLLKHFLLSSSSSVKTVKQKFFNSGHSYNSCDRCFNLIEKEQKLHEVIATTDDWVNIICAARKIKAYVVTKMESGDFFTSKSLHRRFNVNSRKSSKSETNFDWSCVREISQSLETPLNLIFTCENGSTKEIDLSDRNMSKEDFNMANLEVMHPLGKAISKSKYMDLMQLKTHLPENCWNFYDSLRYDATIEKDFGFASDSSDVEN